MRGSEKWVLATALLVAACGPGEPTGSRNGPAGAPAPANPKVLRIAQLNPVTSYGPWDFGNPSGGGASLGEIHTVGLVSEDAQGRIEGRLAARLPSLDDGTIEMLAEGRMRTTWKLRDQIKWHDGTPFHAADLVFSYRMLTHRDLPSGTGTDLGWIHAMEAVDPTSFIITWKAPYYRSLSLGGRELWPFPAHVLGEHFDAFAIGAETREQFLARPHFTTEYVALGPFRLVDFGMGETQVFERFDDFFLGQPRLDRIVIRTMTDPNVVLATLLSGDIDMVSERSLPAQLFIELRDRWGQSREGRVIQRQDNWRFILVQFDLQYARPPELAQDARLRRGLVEGFDPGPIREAVFPGIADTEGDSFMVKTNPLAAAVGKPFARYPYDPGRAIQDLAEGGWRRGPDGRMLNASGDQVQIDLRGDNTDTTDIALLANAWRQLGLEVTENIVPFALARNDEYQATFPAMRLRSYRSNAELLPLFDSRLQPTPSTGWKGLNLAHYANPSLDRLVDQLYSTPDPNQQGRLLRDLAEILATDLPALPVYFRVLFVAVRSNVDALADDYANGTGPNSGPGLLSRHAYRWDLK